MDKEMYDKMSKKDQMAWWKDTSADTIANKKRFVKRMIIEALNKAKDVQGFLFFISLGEEQSNTGGGFDCYNMAMSFLAHKGLK